MKKFYLLIFLLSFSLSSSFATHILGGEITWESLGNDQYVFHLTLYRDCASPSACFATYTIDGPVSIPVSRYSLKNIFPSCPDPSQSLSCTNYNGWTVEENRYKSDTVSLSSTIPASGYSFSYYQCCRTTDCVNLSNPGSSGMFIESVMYQPNVNSPKPLTTLDYYLSGGESLSFAASTGNPDDSLHYEFYTPKTLNGQNNSFSSGYSVNAPIPGPALNPQNGAVDLDPTSGSLSYDFTVASSQLYFVGVEVESWKSGQPAAVIRRDIALTAQPNSASNPPIAVVDTTAYPNINRNGDKYYTEVYLGDTLNFRINAADFDLLPNSGVPESIKFTAEGMALDTAWNSNNNFSSKAHLSPVAPQSGFVRQLNNNVEFNWAIGQEHLSGSSSNYIFIFTFRDNSCATNARKSIQLEVKVNKGTSILRNTSNPKVQICEGDTATLTGYTRSNSYLWSPNSFISNGTNSTAQVFPLSSTWYYLEDPQNPGFKDSVYVEVEQRAGFNLSYANSLLELDDSVNAGSRMWYYNGIPFSYAHDTLTPFAPGYYYVQLATQSCEYLTDTVLVQPGSFSVVQPGNGAYNGYQTSVPGSIGLTFSLDGSGIITSINIPGLRDLEADASGYDLTLRIYDDMQQEQLKKSIQLQPPFDGLVRLPLNFSVAAGKDYTIALTGDTSYAFSFYENVGLPSTPWNNGLHLKAYAEGAAGQFPQQPTDYLIPLGIEVSNFVELQEHGKSNWKVFPNPAKETVYIQGLELGAEVTLSNSAGAVVHQQQATTDEMQIDRQDLPAGIYLLKITSKMAQKPQKIILN